MYKYIQLSAFTFFLHKDICMINNSMLRVFWPKIIVYPWPFKFSVTGFLFKKSIPATTDPIEG